MNEDDVRVGGVPQQATSGDEVPAAAPRLVPPSTRIPLYCVVCLKDGLPEPLALIGDEEVLYADEDGSPVCEACGWERGFLPMLRAQCPPNS